MKAIPTSIEAHGGRSPRGTHVLMELHFVDIALFFYIFTTIVFNEGTSINTASKIVLVIVTLFECIRNDQTSAKFFFNGFTIAALLFLSGIHCLSYGLSCQMSQSIR